MGKDKAAKAGGGGDKQQQPQANTQASFSPLGTEGEGKAGGGELWLGTTGSLGTAPSLHAHTRLRGLLVSHMDDGGAEATLTGDGHHALRLIGQGERAQGASHHRLLPRGGPLPRQHCRWICAERWRQLPPPPPRGGQERESQGGGGGMDGREETGDLEAGRGTGQSKVGAPKAEG